MNADEIVRLRCVQEKHRNDRLLTFQTDVSATARDAAKLIESLQAQTKVTGETSDGYHTFNELYHHRAVLFSVICNERPNVSWKSKLHHDGTMFDGMFIVGIQTPEGQATYHYDIDPYWDMFRVPELPQAPKWDGHTPAQAIESIGRLAQPESTPQTNADRIRSMNNMELAEMLVRYDSNLYRYYCPDGSFCYDEDSALSFALDWLDKPAKEEHHA